MQYSQDEWVPVTTAWHVLGRRMEEQPPIWTVKGKGKPIPLKAWTGPEGSRKLRLSDFMIIDT